MVNSFVHSSLTRRRGVVWDGRQPRRKLAAGLAVMVALATSAVGGAGTADAHTSGDTVNVVSPINATAWFNRYSLASPSSHHIVYRNGAYANDISTDIHAAPGAPVVTPFGTRTNTGHLVESKVIRVGAGCATGVIADGGYRVTIQARDTVTGDVLGYADLMHLSNPAGVGTVLGPWTVVGSTAQWRNTSCYNVTNAAGVHVHVELQNVHRYACMWNLAAGTVLSGTTKIGIVGSHNYTAQRQYC